VGATVDLFPGSQLFRRAKSSSPKTSRSFSRARTRPAKRTSRSPATARTPWRPSACRTPSRGRAEIAWRRRARFISAVRRSTGCVGSCPS